MNGLQLVVLVTAFLFGVVVESLVAVEIHVISVLLIGALLFGLLWRTCSGSWWLVLSLLCVVCVGGVVRTQQFEQQFIGSPLAGEVGERVTLVGVIATEPDERANVTQLFVQTETDRILVRADRFTPVSYGDRVQITGTLKESGPFQTDLGRTFDYPKYLQVRGVQYIVSFADVQVLATDQGNQLLFYLYQAKRYFIDTLEQAILSPQVDLGVGLLLGVKQALGDELETAFRQTGIIHIVVLSGYNVMLVVGFFWWLSSWVLPLHGRIVFGLIGITLFALLVGLSATVVRASIMAAILLIGKLLGRTYDVLRALIFAAVVMVLINPYILLYDIGFQLSFMATLGLVLVLPQFESTLATKSTQLKFKDLFLATVVTQLFVLPLLMYHIGEVSVVSVIVNMLVLPMVPVAMMLTFITGVAGSIYVPLGALVGMVAYLPLQYIIVLAESFARLPYAVLTIPPITVWMVCAMYAGLAIGYWFWLQRRSNTPVQTGVPVLAMPHWEVVDEADVQTGVESSDSTPAHTPIFFR